MSSTSLIDQTVGGTFALHDIILPTGNASTTTDATLLDVDQRRTCGPNSIVKYINLFIQGGVKTNLNGWLEWAVVAYQNEQSNPAVPSNATIGIQTLGDICTKLFCGDCIMTGVFPVSMEVPNVQPIIIKCPQKVMKQQMGNYLKLFMSFRTPNSVDSTSVVRIIASHNYKVYL